MFTVVSVQGEARIYTATDYPDGRNMVPVNNWWDHPYYGMTGDYCAIWSK